MEHLLNYTVSQSWNDETWTCIARFRNLTYAYNFIMSQTAEQNRATGNSTYLKLSCNNVDIIKIRYTKKFKRKSVFNNALMLGYGSEALFSDYARVLHNG